MRTARLSYGPVLAVTAATAATVMSLAAAPALAGEGARRSGVPAVSAPDAASAASVAVHAGACGGARGVTAVDARAVDAGAFTLLPDAAHRATVTSGFRLPTTVGTGFYGALAACPGHDRLPGKPAVAPAAATHHTHRTHSAAGTETASEGVAGPGTVRTAVGITLGIAAACITWLLHRRERGARLWYC